MCPVDPELLRANGRAMALRMLLEAEAARDERVELIHEEIKVMTAALVRLTAAVDQIGARINEVAQALRDHPANEDGQLNALAATLEAGTAELSQVRDGLNQTPSDAQPAAPADSAGGVPSGDPTPGAEQGGEGAPPPSGEQSASS